MQEKQRNVPANNEYGVVAIFSVLAIMGILTLLTLGFSTLTRQAQRRTLDEHLSQQAFYAAESGVNMAADYLDPSEEAVTECDQLDGGGPGINGAQVIDQANNIQVSCLLVNPTPPDLKFNKVPVVGRGEPAIGILEANDPSTNITSIRFEWDSSDRTDGIPPSSPDWYPKLRQSSDWDARIGLLRVDLINQGNTVSSIDSQISRTYSFYLYPSEGGSSSGTASSGLYNHGQIFESHCTNPTGPTASENYRCSITIDLTPFSSVYGIRVTPYYNEADIRLVALDGANDVALKHGQAEVDSTGKAGDVYRRINVRIPLSKSKGMHEPFAIFGGQAICKRYFVGPGFISNTADPLCDL